MKINKRIKSLVGFFVIILLLLGGGTVLKNILLNQIRNKIQSSFDYTHLHLSFFPAALILEDARARSLAPTFSAKKIVVKVSFQALLTRRKPFNVYIERPVIRIYSTSQEKDKKGKTKFDYSLPLVIEKGLIKEGELYFEGKDVSFLSRKINALFVRKKDHFSIRAEAERSVFSPGSTRPMVKGKVSLLIESRGREVDVKKINIRNPDFILKAKGRLVDPFNPEFELKTFLKAKTGLLVDLLHLPFEWEGKTEGRGILTRKNEEIAFKGNFSNKSLILNRVFMGKVEGRIDYNEKAGGTVELNILKRSFPREFARIHFGGGKVWGIVRGFHLDPIANYASLPWPIASPAWGSFAKEKGKLRAEAEFKDEYIKAEQDGFPFKGLVQFEWDGKNEFAFSSENLSSGFALVDVKGEVNIAQNVDVIIQGEINDVRQAREFTSLILKENFDFPEIRGKGRANLHIFGAFDSPQIQADFSFSPGGFDKFDVNSVEGEAEVIEKNFLGRFKIDDPFMRGKINLLSNQEGVKTDIQLNRGFVEKILPALDIKIPLQGETSGNFKVKQKDEDIQLQGAFSSSLMKFANRTLREASGKIKWEGGALTLSELQFYMYQGVIKGSASVDISSQEFDINILGEKIDLSSLYAGVQGNLKFDLKGKSVFGENLASGHFEIENLACTPLQMTTAKGEAKLGYSSETLYLELDGNFLPGRNEFNIKLNYPFNMETFSVDVKGKFSNLNLLLPWKGAEGGVNYLAEIKGQKVFPQVKGVIDFQGPVFPLPKFAHALRDYSGLMFVENRKVSLRSLNAKLGGGDVYGFGELMLGKEGIENIDFRVEGKNMLLSPLERTRALTDGSLSIIKGATRFILDGNFLIQKLSWRRELNEKFVFSSSPYYQSQEEPGFFDDLTLNVQIKADDNAWMENSLGRVRGRFDLNLTGNVNAPMVLGDIEALGGNVYFQDRKFKILSGRVSFFNPSAVEPHISFKGETYVKDYRVTFSLNGLLDRLNPEFSSSPPLPPEDVLALLALGESFRRTYSHDTSTQLSTASLLSFQLSEEAKKSAEGLFVIDRFRIDPFVMGSSAEMAARLTVGKKISRNFFILYSTNLTAQREEVTRIEWELSDDFSVVGTRDEKGRVSIDVKIHKRF